MNLYHVTNSSYASDIKSEGFQSRGIPDYYSPRYEFEVAVDTIGRGEYTSWSSRVHGVFFWESIEQARNNTQERAPYDMILECDKNKLPSPQWCIESEVLESTYRSLDRPSNVQPGDSAWKKARDIVEASRHYDGTQQRVEVWCSGPVSPDAIDGERPLSR